MKRWTLPILLVLAVLGILAGWVHFTSGWTRGAMLSRQIATEGLAQQLVRVAPKAKVLVVCNPFTTSRNQPRTVYLGEQAGVRGLQKVLGKEAMTLAFPQLKRGALEHPHDFEMPRYTSTPVAYLLAEGAFDTLASKNPKCDYIVSLIGIPPDFPQLQIWQRADGPKLAFLLPDLWMLGNKQAIASAFKSGKVAAAVINKPDVPPDQMLDPKADFSKRFILLTADNIDEIVAKYPLIFEAPENGKE